MESSRLGEDSGGDKCNCKDPEWKQSGHSMKTKWRIQSYAMKIFGFYSNCNQKPDFCC